MMFGIFRPEEEKVILLPLKFINWKKKKINELNFLVLVLVLDRNLERFILIKINN